MPSHAPNTGVGDWQEFFDPSSGRVFFSSSRLDQVKWGLPLDEIVPEGEVDRELSLGWCLHVDPATRKKFYANESKSKAQWFLPAELRSVARNFPYLQEKKSSATGRDARQEQPHAPESKEPAPSAPKLRRMTLRMIVQKLTLDKIMADRETFRAFQLFSATFHSEENILFFCVVEAFSHRGAKSVSVLGLDDMSKASHAGLPRTKSHLQQIALDKIQAERAGTTLEQIQLAREARAIYDRFLAPGAPDWVCVDQKAVESIKQFLDAEDLTAPAERYQTLFETAQSYVYQNLEHDLLPRFIKAALKPGAHAHGAETTGSSEEDHAEEREDTIVLGGTQGTTPVFVSDEVLRHHLIQLQKKINGASTPLMSTANAYQSLFPSPRYAIEGRPGSGLAPSMLRLSGEQTADELPSNEVLAQPQPQRPTSTRRPFSARFFGIGKPLPPTIAMAGQGFATMSVNTATDPLKRRSSTGMNRRNPSVGSTAHIRDRSRSKSDTPLSPLDVAPIDLDAVEFELVE